MALERWQAIYIGTGIAILPVAPFLYLLGQYTRYKVGVLPEPDGPRTGIVGGGKDAAKLLVIGESTVAGLGARTHDLALAGQFARQLSERIGRPVEWTVVGRNGVTAQRTIDELIPLVPDTRFDYILIGLGGNDVMKLSSPKKWRSTMLELLGILRKQNPASVMFITNCPMIKYSPAIPQPIRSLLWELSKLHDLNIKDFTNGMDRVLYYHQPEVFKVDGFFADGIHPSEQGYRDWATAMMDFFGSRYKW
ncbi:MAG TPA: SGNH/GDSL hydrolase family protein [Pyrinomonadaceae bacterium]|nr:SGNH/GDSL hydrolase family protein [Pyrinomonadaceae bacterium]